MGFPNPLPPWSFYLIILHGATLMYLSIPRFYVLLFYCSMSISCSQGAVMGKFGGYPGSVGITTFFDRS